jgi:hypothetical protein
LRMEAVAALSLAGSASKTLAFLGVGVVGHSRD